MKAGDIIFVHGDNCIAKIIEFFDKGRFSHCAIAVSDTEIFEIQYPINVKQRKIPAEYSNYVVMDLGLKDEQRARIPIVASKFKDRQYDYFQVLGYLFYDLLNIKGKNILNDHKRLICSELVYIILKDSNILNELDIRIKDGIDATPNSLYNYLLPYGKVYK